MPLVFSLPFCLPLPDGNYQVKLNQDEIVTLNLTKVIPKIYDERLPYRGFLKGELENISTLKIWDEFGASKWVSIDQLEHIKEKKFVIEYKTKDGKEIVPEVDVSHDININPENSDRRHMHAWGRKLVVNAEVIRDPFGRFRYTKVSFTSSKDLHFEDQFKMAVKAVNILISRCRRITGDYWITKVREEDIFIYKAVEDDSFDLSYVAKGIGQIRPDHSQTKVNHLRESLMSDEAEYPFFQLMLDAKYAFEQTNYHLAIIYSITALESIVKTFLFFRLRHDKAIANKILRMTLNQLVTVILPLMYPADDKRKLINDIIKDIALRNKIIHEGELGVSKNESKKAIEDIDLYFQYIGEKFKDLNHSSD